MNQRIEDYIDGLFTGVTLEGEAAELHDELCANCAARFDDLVHQGYSEDEAFSFVREGMGDIDEIIAPYRRSAKREKTAPEESAAPYYEEAFSIDGVTTLDIEPREATVTIVPTDAEKLLVVYETDMPGATFVPPIVSCEDGSLCVRVQKPHNIELGFDLQASIQSIINGVMGRVLKNARLTLSVPRGMMPNVHVNGISGRVRIEDIALRSANVHLASGSIELQADPRLRANFYELHTVSGSIKVSGSANTLQINTMSGSVKAKCDAQDVTAHTVSGSIRLDGTTQNAELKSVSGSIHFDCPGIQVQSIAAQSISGSIHIALPEAMQGVLLKAATVSGRVHNDFAVLSPDAQNAPHISATTTSGSIHLTKLSQ